MAGKGDKRRPMSVPNDIFSNNWDTMKWDEPVQAGFDSPPQDPLSAIPVEETPQTFLSQSDDMHSPEELYGD